MVGLVSEAHLAMAEKTLPIPVSFGFSRPRIARCFITDTNSWEGREGHQGCKMAKFDPFLSLDCARAEGVGAQSKERKGSNFAA